MLVYFIFAFTCFIIIGGFLCLMNWRWQKRVKDLEQIFKRLDLPQIDLEDIRTRVPFQ